MSMKKKPDLKAGMAGIASATSGSAATQFAYALRLVARRPLLLFWTLAFPILLSLLFTLVLGTSSERYHLQPADVAVVKDATYRSDSAALLRETLEAAATSGDGQQLKPTYVSDIEAGDALLSEGTVDAVIAVDADGAPYMHVGPAASGSASISAVHALLDRCRSVSASMDTLASEAPQALTTPDAQASAASAFAHDTVHATSFDILHTAPAGNVRFFYALLAYATVQSTIIVLSVIEDTRANMSPAGFRRQVGAVSQTRLLLTALGSSYLATFACCLAAWAFQRFILGIPFGGRDGLAVLAVAACAAVGVTLGALISAIPRISQQAKESLSLAVTLIASLGAGLYGDPAMALSDWLSANMPALQLVNPAAQAVQAFYSLLYYTDLQPFWNAIGALIAMAAVYLAIEALLVRRQRYEAL